MSKSHKLFRSFIASFFIFLGIAGILLPRLINWVLGSFFITLGIAGAILPVVNGTFFLVIGLILISFESKYVETRLHHLTKKSALIHKWHLYLENWLRKYFVRKDKK